MRLEWVTKAIAWNEKNNLVHPPDGRRWAAQPRRLFPLLVRFQTCRYAMTQRLSSSDCFMKTIWFVLMLWVASALEMRGQVVPNLATQHSWFGNVVERKQRSPRKHCRDDDESAA